MWSDESRFNLFQNDGRIRRETDEVMHPSCPVPVQVCGGSAMIWSCCSWSNLSSATLSAWRMRSADYLNMLNDQVIPSMDYSSLMAQACSKMTMPGFIGLKLWKSGSGNMRHHFHTWIGHRRVQTLTPLRIFGMYWRRLCTVVRLPYHQYKILVKNYCNPGRKKILWHCRSLSKQCHSECVP